ncbi:MAG TPA: hypothetical protein VKZ49_03235 [Polyangiaceae bacterium]|nr:hypothetical protein [Polyangiaceae bacterium]
MKLTGFLMVASLLLGCSDDADAPGTATITTWGEAFIEQGIPAEELADGWSVRFEEFLVVLGPAYLRRGGEVASLDGSQLIDLVQAGPHTLGTLELAPGSWDDVGYALAPASDDTRAHASATAEQLAAMQTGPYSVRVRGRATHAEVTKTFDWAFATAVNHSRCEGASGGRAIPGVELAAGGAQEVELTIHGDHLFYDDLVAEAPDLRFATLAEADDAGDADGAIDLEELASVSLSSVSEGPYGTGNADVDQLAEFLEAQVATLGHFQGEGHCDVERQ